MKSSDTRLYRKLLLALRAHLRGEINLLVDIALDVALDDVLPTSPCVCRSCRPVWYRGTARTMKRYIERLIEAKERALALVEKALRRVDTGTYGICRHCGAPIPNKQIVSAPYRAACAACDTEHSPEIDLEWTHITNRGVFRG
jgi:hypothetical protein